MDLNEKRQKLNELVTAQRAILDKAKAETRDLSGDETTTYERMDGEVEALDQEINAAAARSGASSSIFLISWAMNSCVGTV
jgi:hypothetical protein